MSDLKPFVGAKDYENSLRFYTAIGFTVNWNTGQLAEIETPGGSFLLQDYYEEQWCNNSVMHLSVSDVGTLYLEIRDILANGDFGTARINEPIQEDYRATVAYLWDPSGVLWHLAQYQQTDSA